MISVAITTYNEAEKVKNCLNSVKDLADEIIVVDLGSKDNIENICKKFGAKIYHHEFVPFVELVRNYAVSKANGDWVFILDPDEEVSDGLKSKISEIVNVNRFVAVNIPRKNIFFGKWIRHTNWWPDYHIRFFKKGCVAWMDKIHLYPNVDGEIIQLKADPSVAIIHHGYESIKGFIDRQNRYSEIEAKQKYKEGERFSWINLIFWPTREFLARYIRHAGFLDGFYGFALTYLMMIYQLQVMIKLWELKEEGKSGK